MSTFLQNGININYNIIGYILLFPFVFFWIWSILFVTKDISRRTSNLFYQLFSILLVAIGTPIVGLPLYFIIRPSRYIDDIFWRKNLETFSIQCMECGEFNNKDFKYCVFCGERLIVSCKECSSEYYIGYDYCPYCGAPNLENLEVKK